MKKGVTLSFVIPVRNEEDSVALLHKEVSDVATKLGVTHEIIFIDDGSTDKTLERLRALKPVRVLSFTRNFGKSQALQAGFDAASGEYLVTLDGDLQDDPQEIPRFLERLQKGADLVCGWKKKRYDPLGKRLVSKAANAVTSTVAGSPVHDMNCGFKGYRREVLSHLRLYGDMHRYIPALVAGLGFRVEELVVNHRARRFGSSKYGLKRILNSMFDFLTLLFLRRFTDRPMYFFGSIGFLSSGIGGIILVYLGWVRLGLGELIGHRPLLTLGVLLTVVGLQFISLGLIGELLIRQRTEGRVFVVRESFESA